MIHLDHGWWEIDTFNRSRLDPRVFWIDNDLVCWSVSWGHEGGDPVWRIEGEGSVDDGA